MSPTILREGEYRLFFFSREESRPHAHVSHPEGEAKFWIEPDVSLARNIGLRQTRLNEVEAIVNRNRATITNA
ncbi:MAG: DUF4160 domain-containing protein [Cyanobacteria bacterium K_DeepCast_35m_m1_288]|nr:DUF4160 domain-containing protein [Cyanobacteria bacterium K_DeepCast_35m_m1_288]